MPARRSPICLPDTDQGCEAQVVSLYIGGLGIMHFFQVSLIVYLELLLLFHADFNITNPDLESYC